MLTGKIPRDHEFPRHFHVCRFQREEACSRIRQQREYLFLLLQLSACTLAQ